MVLKRANQRSALAAKKEERTQMRRWRACWFLAMREAIAVPVAKLPLGQHSITLLRSGPPSRSTCWHSARKLCSASGFTLLG